MYWKRYSAVALALALAVLAAMAYLVAFDLAHLGIRRFLGWVVSVTPVEGSVARWANAHLEPAFLVSGLTAWGLLPIAIRIFYRRVWPAIERKVVGPAPKVKATKP